MVAARATLLCLVLMSTVGCRELTQAVIVVDTDMSPEEMDSFEIEVLGPDDQMTYGPFSRSDPAMADPPWSMGVRPKDGDPDRSVTIRVSGYKTGDVVIEKTRTIERFEKNETITIEIYLTGPKDQEDPDAGPQPTEDGGMQDPVDAGMKMHPDGGLPPPDAGEPPQPELPWVTVIRELRSFQTPQLSPRTSVALENGGLVVGLTFDDQLEAGDHVLNPEQDDAALIWVSADGSVERVVGLQGQGDQRLHALAVRPDGGFEVAGAFNGELTTTSTPATIEDANGWDLFVVSLGPDGALENHVRMSTPDGFGGTWGSPGFEPEVIGIHPTQDGTILVLSGRQPSPFDCADTTDLNAGDDRRRGFIVKLDTDLQCVWARSFGAANDVLPATSLYDAAGGRIIVAGSYEAAVTFATSESGRSTLAKIGLDDDAFIAEFDAADGFALGSAGLGGDDFDGFRALSLEPTSGHILAGGSLRSSTLDFQGQPVVPPGRQPIAVMFNSDLSLIDWVHAVEVGTGGLLDTNAMTIGSNGELLVALEIQSGVFTFDPDGAAPETYQVGAEDDVCVAVVQPGLPGLNGLLTFGGNGDDEPVTVHFHPTDGSISVVGYFEDSVKFPPNMIEDTDGRSAFVYRYAGP